MNSEFTRATRVLLGANAPILLLGPGARPAMHLAGRLASRLGAAVLTTPDAKSMFDETSPYAAGVCSFGANARARQIARAADVVLAIGTNLGEFASEANRAFEHADVVQVTDDPAEVPLGVTIAAALIGDVAIETQALLRATAAAPPKARWFERLPAPAPAPLPQSARGARGMNPFEAMQALGDAMPHPSRLACDITSAGLHALHGLTLGPDRRLWMQVERSACMGSALSAGLGIRLASELPTVVLIGDWGLVMGSTELHTAAALKVAHFVIVVWSNSGGALIRAGVRAQGIGVPRKTHTWPSPGFESIARGYGLRASTVRTAAALRKAVSTGIRAGEPVLVDALIDPEGEIPGAKARFVHLDNSKRAS